ncbi:MAG: helix-turn-helix domain-containing protein [Acidobacteriota bacterium]
MVKRLIGIEEAAGYLGVKKATLYSWAWKRAVPSVKMGRRLLFDLKDLDELIDLRKRGASDTIGTALSDITPKRR